MDDNIRTDQVADDVITVIIHLAERLRQAPSPEFNRTSTILEIIRDTAESERKRCLDAWIETVARPSTDDTDQSLPF